MIIFPPKSNLTEAYSHFSPGIPLGAEEGSELGALTPPGHTQSFGSPIKNLEWFSGIWHMECCNQIPNFFFNFHPLDAEQIFFSPISRAPRPSGFFFFFCPCTTLIPLRSNPSYKIRVLFCTSGENSIPLMFFWMLIPVTPLSSRSIFPLLVINSLDSYK